MRTYLPTVLAVLGAALLVPALIDPVEGGLPFILASALLLVAAMLSKVALSRLVWISLLVAFLAGITALAIALAAMPDRRERLWLAIVAAVWVYRAGIIAAFVGAIRFIMQLGRAARSQTPSSHAPTAV